MDRYDSWYAREYTTHQDQVLDAIKDYHYFAPAMLARSATQAQRRAETAIGRWEEPIEVTDRASVSMQAVRTRLGAHLIRLGILLRDGHVVEPGTPPAIVAATPRAGG
jgi:hypothetical protein